MSSEVRLAKRDGSSDPRRRRVCVSSTGKDDGNAIASNIKVDGDRIEIDVEDGIPSVKFLPDGKHVVSGAARKIRRWRVADGKKVGESIDAGSRVVDLAVSRDGRWIVAGTEDGRVTVWNATNHEKVTDFQAHSGWVTALDISPDSTRIATGSADKSLSVWSILTGQRLLGAFKHDYYVVSLKFSPDGHLIATATKDHESVRVYDGHDGRLHVQLAIYVSTAINGSLIFTGDGKQLLVLSLGAIHCLEVSTWTTLSTWIMDDKKFIALAPNDRFIATSGSSSFSLWDTTSQNHLVVVNLPRSAFTVPMDISSNYDIAVAPNKKIILQHLLDILPSRYRDDIVLVQEPRCPRTTNIDLPADHSLLLSAPTITTPEEIQRLRDQLASSNEDNQSLRIQYETTKNKLDKSIRDVANLEKLTRGLRDQLATSEQEKESLRSTVQSLHARQQNLDDQLDEIIGATWEDSARKINNLEQTIQGLQFTLRMYKEKDRCELAFSTGRIDDAAKLLFEIVNTISEDLKQNEVMMSWLEDFKQRCINKLERYGDVSADHDVAIGYYSSALSLHPININNIILKCSKARSALLEEELARAFKDIEHDPSNYKGYRKKHSVLHNMCCYWEAFSAFKTMLYTMRNSADPRICELQSRYLDPTSLIREVVHDTIRDIPRVLIDTVTGRLCDKQQQAAAFEELGIFDQLRSTMTTLDRLDYVRIKKEVEKFYQYVMLSHRWQLVEPTFQMVENTSIRELAKSPVTEKLIAFYNLVRSQCFRWAWSDTCCVNQSDKGVQQESVVAMFRWYRRAALTIVHLLGVCSWSQKEGDLWKSVWNTRGWTYQEYVASNVIQFYTQDWKPYLNLKLFNHKKSPIILSEMERATEFTTERLATIKPGLERAREKLYLASKRRTAREEDIAYSLFGIFNVAIPIIYGEGHQAVGRLLEHILTRSDNVTILSWTGTSGNQHSYLPSDLTVYDRVPPPHVPQAMEAAEMNEMVIKLQTSFPDRSSIIALYKQLLDLPSLSLVSGRLRLPGFVFHLTDLACLTPPGSDIHVYRATSPILGEVQIETTDDSVGTRRLVLVHPWIGPLIEEDFSDGDALCDLDTRAVRLLVRLWQPFGALLLASQKRGQYIRVATDSFIEVQIRAETLLSELMANVGSVDVH